MTESEIRRSMDREHTRLSERVVALTGMVAEYRVAVAALRGDRDAFAGETRARDEQLGRERQAARLEIDALRTELAGERARRERAEAELGRLGAHSLAPDTRPDGQARIPARERACGDCRCPLCEARA